MIWLAQFAATLAGRLWIIGAAVASIVGAYQLTKYKGVKQERARVSAEAMKTDAKATPARRAAERDPDGVLKRYLRD